MESFSALYRSNSARAVKHFAGSVRLYVDAEISLKLLAILAVLKRVQIGTRSADRKKQRRRGREVGNERL